MSLRLGREVRGVGGREKEDRLQPHDSSLSAKEKGGTRTASASNR